MSVVRRTAAVAVASGVTALAGLVPVLPAMAHGATTQPISRTAACAIGGEDVTSAACRAARDANGGPFGNFDNLRVPGVNGKDQQRIPKGNLCSGGLPAFHGLDLARDDWPVTRLTAGETISIRYASTIPHEGEFRVYLTKQGYDPKKPLGWDDLGASPIVTATDPPLRAGAYRFSGKLPTNRSGRHVLYVVWQNSSTPDTYYSCSDLILKPDGTGVAAPAKKPAKAKPLAARESGAVAAPADASGRTIAAGAPAARESWRTTAEDDDRLALGRHVASAALIVLSGVTAGAAIVRMRRARAAQRIPGRSENR